MKEARSGDSKPAIACDFTAMDTEQSERYRALRRLLGDDFHEVRELENGYAFRHSSEASVLLALAEYVSLERLCCPFFDFAIEVGRGGGEVWLRMTGGDGAKGVLEAALGVGARGEHLRTEEAYKIRTKGRRIPRSSPERAPGRSHD